MLLEGSSDRQRYVFFFLLFEIFSIVSVILIGVLFSENYYSRGYQWKTNPFGYHPLIMTIGLFFLFGNSILIYRTFTKQRKIQVKILHALLLIGSFVFALVGLTAIIRNKNLTNRSHLMSYHSWFGVFTLALFFLQWLLGFSIFLFDCVSLHIRRRYLSSHQFWGRTIFFGAMVSILTGLSEYGTTSSFFPPNDTNLAKRMLIIFSCLFCSFGTFVVLYLLSKLEFQRVDEQNNSYPDSLELHSNKR